jgi:glutathione S-transferase
MRRLYGRVSSINVQKVAWTLEEIGLEFEWVDKNGTVRSIDSPNYRKINPAAQIPTFDDNGTLLRQSNAIVRYLAHSYPEGKLYPTEPEACAEAERWMEWQATDLWNALRPVFWGLIRIKPKHRDLNFICKNIKICHQEALLLNDFLSDRSFIAGDKFSMGDIPAGCAIYRYYALPEEFMKWPDLPNLKAWLNRLSKRKGFRDFIMLPLV